MDEVLDLPAAEGIFRRDRGVNFLRQRQVSPAVLARGPGYARNQRRKVAVVAAYLSEVVAFRPGFRRLAPRTAGRSRIGPVVTTPRLCGRRRVRRSPGRPRRPKPGAWPGLSAAAGR